MGKVREMEGEGWGRCGKWKVRDGEGEGGGR